jgi:metallo-beta-lactamase class B
MGVQMRTVLSLTALVICLITVPAMAQVADRQMDDKPAAPFQVFDNLYYVGFESACAWVIKTSAGLILIDAGYDHLLEHIPNSVRQLGLNLNDAKYLLINHAHTDHTGAANHLKGLVPAMRIGMAQGDWDFQASGSYMNSQGIPRKFQPIPRDMVLRDQETLTLGDTTLKFHILPGHTPGDTTIEFTAVDGNRRYKTVLFSGMGTAFTGAKAAQEHLDRVRRLMAVPEVQVTLSDHTNGIQLFEKAAKLKARRAGEPHPFVDGPAAFRAAMQPRLASAEKKLADERAANRP